MPDHTPENTSADGSCRLGRPVVQPVPERYVVHYVRDDYVVADAFRPDWSWGKKGYVVKVADLGEHTDDDVIRAAQQTAPQGYWLQWIEAIGGEPHRRDVFKKAVPWSLSKTPDGAAMNAEE